MSLFEPFCSKFLSTAAVMKLMRVVRVNQNIKAAGPKTKTTHDTIKTESDGKSVSVHIT